LEDFLSGCKHLPSGHRRLDNYNFLFNTSSRGLVFSPVVLWAHGGAYVGDDKANVGEYASCLACDGYAVVYMNYELAPKGHYRGSVISEKTCRPTKLCQPTAHSHAEQIFLGDKLEEGVGLCLELCFIFRGKDELARSP
jgi:hypothetical protein